MVQNHRKPLKAMVARPKTIEKPLIAMVRPPKNIQWWWSPPKPLKISNGLLKPLKISNGLLKTIEMLNGFLKIIQLDLVSSNQWNSQCSLKRTELSCGHNITNLDYVFWSLACHCQSFLIIIAAHMQPQTKLCWSLKGLSSRIINITTDPFIKCSE